MFRSLPDLVFDQATRAPEQAAVISELHDYPYRQLVAKADSIACELQQRGLGPECLIGVCMRRSIDLPVCLLGVLRAGCTFLPLDPAQPLKRLTRILADARPALLLVDDFGAQALATTDFKILSAASVQEPRSRMAERHPFPAVYPDSLAYVIYTSGSTGEPKGVEISHRSILSTVVGVNHLCALHAGDRLLNLSPIGFDLSVYDFFGAWLAGATTVLPNETPHPDPGYWAKLMSAMHITVWNSAPAMLQLLVDHLGSRMETAATLLTKLRLVMLSGDRITPSLVQRISRLRPGSKLLAMGGATEASIWSTHNFVQDLPADARFVPYGVPLPGQTVSILDPEMREVPEGEVGELYIGGTALARGYRHRADLTAAAFVPHPTDTGTRLYRTGDLVRKLPNGNAEFIGRKDGQVKIRGFRVEIAEVERALLTLEPIEQAVVTCRRSSQTEELTAHLTLKSPMQTASTAQIRELLAKVLPAYMIPTRIHFLSVLPLTENGKVDRAGLRENAPITPPYTEQISAIFKEVLRLQHVDVLEHFLDLGGNSLLAGQIVNRISDYFHMQLSIADVFANATILQLSALLARQCPSQPATH